VQEHIDATTPGGRLVFHVFGALASFERELIQERTLAGLAAARERGRRGGRPSVLSPAKLRQARKMIGEKTPVTEVAQVLGVSRSTLYRRVPELGEARTRPAMNEPEAGVSASPYLTGFATEATSGCSGPANDDLIGHRFGRPTGLEGDAGGPITDALTAGPPPPTLVNLNLGDLADELELGR